MPKRQRTYKKARRRTRRRTRRYSRISKPAVRSMIRRALRPHTNVIRLTNSRITQGLTANAVVYNLTLISAATKVFATQPMDIVPRHVKHVKMNLDVLVSTGTENDGVTVTAYIVSLKNNTNDEFFNATTGGITSPVDTTYTIVDGQAYVNPEYYTIHKRVKLFFPPHAGDDTGHANLHRRFTWNHRPNTLIRNVTGRFEQLVCPNLPSQNYYLIMFNNNSGTDLEFPTVTFHCLNTYVC